MLKNYIFDLGGVLLDIRMKNAYERFVALGLPPAELEPGGSAYKLMEDYQLGFITSAEFCQQIASKCAANAFARCAASPTTPHDIEDAWNSICLSVADRKLQALRKLRKMEGVASVSLLSNTNELHWERCCQNWFNANGNKLEDFFDKIFLSQELHLQKPDPEIFKTAIRELGASPAETIFLDDSPVNTAAAAACGLQTLTVTADVDWVEALFSQVP
ncbi:putative hydrolase of the HAD superfamily [Fibrobacter sp. UWB16]|uniref:HAD family hydrolase n=1 Tax=Fibrobacter sp. UWB16 TaxID=1945874 RepID=UPI000BD6027B|nr:HAD family phosphatase [Fibrobacter sp. UWB16]SOD13478.1 putative hydrolase of the HAD superfamily [Fibrobacter sp. UWB16]